MHSIRRHLERLAVFAVLWWVLSEAQPASWPVGVLFVAAAAVVSVRLTPSHQWRIRPLGLIRFVGFFAYHSVIGGVDVALRALRPSMPIAPGFVRVDLRLPTETSRVLLADTVSLLPGTLSAGLVEGGLVLHVLDCTLPVSQEVRRVEERIADALGLPLPDDEPAEAQVSGGG